MSFRNRIGIIQPTSSPTPRWHSRYAIGVRTAAALSFGLVVGLLLSGIFGCSDRDRSTEPERPLRISLSPSEIDIASGESFEVAIRIENVSGLFAARWQVLHPAVEVGADDPVVTAGDLSSPAALLLAVPETGKVSVGLTEVQTGGRDGMAGSGTLAVLRLRALAPVSGTLELDGIDLIDEDGEPLDGMSGIEVASALLTVR